MEVNIVLEGAIEVPIANNVTNWPFSIIIAIFRYK
jgi:hypothetical protein